MINADDKARFRQNSDTGLGIINKKIDIQTKRMAGAALLAVLGPSALALLDDQQSDFGGSAIAGIIGATGLLGGGYIGYRGGVMPEDERDTYIRSEVSQLKKASKELAKKEGVQASVNEFARSKQALIDDISGMAPQYNDLINARLRQIPELGSMAADLNLGNRTPREVKGMTKGALIGALGALVPGYIALRNGPVEE